MSKSIRLVKLMHLLRTLPAPVKADQLAEELQVSVRSIYRDIDALRQAGAVIDGEAGYGYTMQEDPALPPMMFNTDEIEALVLGLKEVQETADPVLAGAAMDALAKIKASLPESMRHTVEHAVLYAKRFRPRAPVTIDVSALRQATRDELAIDIEYVDLRDNQSSRRVLPLSIVFLENALVVLAWCTMRKANRMFRLDRIQQLSVSDQSFRPRRVPLLRDCLEEVRNRPTQRSEPFH